MKELARSDEVDISLQSSIGYLHSLNKLNCEIDNKLSWQICFYCRHSANLTQSRDRLEKGSEGMLRRHLMGKILTISFGTYGDHAFSKSSCRMS